MTSVLARGGPAQIRSAQGGKGDLHIQQRVKLLGLIGESREPGWGYTQVMVTLEGYTQVMVTLREGREPASRTPPVVRFFVRTDYHDVFKRKYFSDDATRTIHWPKI